MKIQVRRLAVALAIAVPIAVAATAKSSAAPINGMSIKAAVPAATTDVRYRVRRDYAYPSYGAIPAIIHTGATRLIIPIGAIRPITPIGAIRPITTPIQATLTASGDARHWQRAAPSEPPLANMYLRDSSIVHTPLLDYERYCGDRQVRKVPRPAPRRVSTRYPSSYLGVDGMAEEWWSTICHRSPFLT
jgi:hypothetical protein